MTLAQTRRTFLDNSYYLSRYQNAAFSAFMVAVCLGVARFVHMGPMAGSFIIGAQSVTGVNRQGPFRIRLGIAAKAALILTGSAAMGALAGSGGLPVTLLLAVALAFSFGWWRQLFPLNWPDIIFPSGVLFFMSYVHPAVTLTFFGALTGLVAELLLGVFVYLRQTRHDRRTREPEVLPPPMEGDDKTLLGLRMHLVLYCVELSVILIAGFLIMHATPYPHAYWIPLTGVLVLKVGRHATLKRVLERTFGTLIGCLLASAVVYLHPHPLLESTILVGCIFIWLVFLRERYAIAAIFITTFVLLLLSEQVPDQVALITERIAFTLLGGLLAFLTSLIFLNRERL